MSLLRLPICLVACLFMMTACEKSYNPGTARTRADTVDLIKNYTFEYNGLPLSEGWIEHNNSDINFVQDAPPGGGKWSLMLKAEWGPPEVLVNSIPAQPGLQVLRYSIWSRMDRIGGIAVFMLKRTDTLIMLKKFDIADTVWSRYSFTDTLTLSEGDTLMAELSGGFSQLLAGTTWFDLCRIEKIPANLP
jgi:hypothetical protein